MARSVYLAPDTGRIGHSRWAKRTALCLAALYLVAASTAVSAGRQGAASSTIKLRGRVVGTDGRPVTGLQVFLYPIVNKEPSPGSADRPLTTGADGRFTVTTRRAQSYYVLCQGTADYRQVYGTYARAGATLQTVTMKRRLLTGPEFVGSVGRAAETRCQDPTCFCLDAHENLLVADEPARVVRVVSKDDKLVAKWPLKLAPQAMEVREDGSVLVAGRGNVAILDSTGKQILAGGVPGAGDVSSVTHLGNDVFVCASGGGGFAIYRLDGRLSGPKKIVSGLSGCCGQMDVRGHNGILYVAENTRFSIVKYDRTGKKLGEITHSKKEEPAYFGDGCCEPKNLCFGPDGTIYAAASSPMHVKRYAPDGKYLGMAGKVPDPDGSCVRVTIALTKSGKLYMLDTDNKLVRLLRPPALAKRS